LKIRALVGCEKKQGAEGPLVLAPALGLRMLEVDFFRRPVGAEALADEVGNLSEGQLCVLAPVEDVGGLDAVLEAQ
jgi:hypothetical protein